MTAPLHDPAVTASVIPPPSPWPNVIDLGGLNLLNGSPNAGKTAFIVAVLKRMSMGGDIFGHPIPATPSAFLALDRPWKNSGASLWFQRYHFETQYYSFVDDRGRTADYFAGDQPWNNYLQILAGLNAPAGTQFVADTLERAYGDVMSRQKVMIASTQLYRYLIDCNYAQTGIMHSGKMKGAEGERYANVHEQMAGTGALSGYSSTQMTLLAATQTKGGKLCQLHITAHGLPGMIYDLPKDELGCFRLDDAVSKTDALTPGIPTEFVAVLDALEAGPLTRTQLGERFADMGVSTLERLLTKLVRGGWAERPLPGVYHATNKAKVPNISDL